MEKVAFIGSFDKTDLIMYVAKMLTLADKKVLVVDTTLTQKARYVVPNIEKQMFYITEFENIDVAVGFFSMEDIQDYIAETSGHGMSYDYALIDIDTSRALENFEIDNTTKNYFVTSFDLYSLRRGLEAVSNLKEPLKMTKVLFSMVSSKNENDYLEYLAKDYKIEWDEYKLYFPFERGDQTAIIDNQRVAKIKFGNLSQQYRETLTFIAEDIQKNTSSGKFKKLMKNQE